MKKFLFTLAMLLMAGAAFADSYLYINKADVLTGDQKVEVPVKAHFSEYVSAWQVTITLPDGINFDGRADVGQDMTIPYFTDRGKTANYTLSLSQNGVGGFLAASQQEGFYKLNGTWTSHGAIKWAPGDYDEMIILYLEVTDAYTGGDIMITTEPMSGADPRDIPKAVVDGGRTLPWVDEAITAAEPTLAVDNEENPTQVTTNGVLYYCNETMTPGAWNIVTAPYTLPEATDVEQVLHFMAYTPNDEGKNDSKFVYLTVTIPAAAQEAAPAATISKEGNVVTAAVDGEEAGTHAVELYIVTTNDEGEEVLTKVDNPYTVEQTFSEQKITFKAKTIANEGESGDTWSEPKEITIPAKADVVAPKPTIANNEGVVSASCEGHTVKFFYKNDQGEWVEAESFTLPENNTFEDKTYEFKAYTIANGTEDNINSDEVTASFTVPGKEDKVAPKPTIANNNGVVSASCEGHTVKFFYKNDQGEWVEADSFELPENNTFDPITYYFKAYTVANGTDDNINSEEVTKEITVPGKNDNQAPKPTIKEENGVVTVIAPEEGLEVELYVKENGEWKLVNGGSYTLPTNDSYTDDITVDFYAITKPDGEKYNLPSDEEYYTATVDKLDKNVAQKPTIVGTNLTNTTKDIVITPDPNTDGTLVVEANPAAPGRAAAQTMTYERKDADYYVHVKAWTTEGDTYLASEVAEEDILIPAKPAPKVYKVPDPTITVDNSDPTKTVITIEATEGVLTYNIDAEEGVAYTVEEVEGKVIITVVNGDETAFVNVTATTTLTEVPAGYDEVKNGEAEKNVEIPQYQQTAAPTIDVSFGGEDGAHYANVTFVNNDAKPATIEYSLDNGKTWNTYTPGVPVVINTYGETTVLARATAEGKATSEVAERSFTLSDDATSVNELVNGKTVAGVRYFNMAGQEMQEANGITIVVTTYTDGTTSAVKVIK